jgi:hypothetical protein
MNNDDWDILAADWRDQPAAQVDIAALSRQSMRHGRRLRWALAVELLLSATAIAACAWAAVLPGAVAFPPLAMVALALLVIGFQGWSLWIRRRQVRDIVLDANAMLRLERDRLATSRRYWRVNTWGALLLWVGLWTLLMAGVSPAQSMASLLANVPVLLAFAVFSWWRCRLNQSRLADVQALLSAIRDTPRSHGP